MGIEITLTSEITVRPVQSVGGDAMIVAAAKVSTSGEEALKFADLSEAEGNAGMIGYLMRHRHGTPFEHASMTFFVHAPAMVWWEWVRHRIGHSFNLESGRYKVLEPVFWIPRFDRAMAPSADHKPARPKFDQVGKGRYEALILFMESAYRQSWTAYRSAIDLGIANEVARSVLGFGVYYSGWVTVNPRSLMSFLSLRTHDPKATFVSYPQSEIEEAARACEAVLAEGWPLTYAAFVRNGRVGP